MLRQNQSLYFIDSGLVQNNIRAFFSVSNAARQIGVQRFALQKRIQRGTVKYALINNRVFIPENIVIYEWAKKKELKEVRICKFNLDGFWFCTYSPETRNYITEKCQEGSFKNELMPTTEIEKKYSKTEILDLNNIKIFAQINENDNQVSFCGFKERSLIAGVMRTYSIKEWERDKSSFLNRPQKQLDIWKRLK